MAAEGALQSLEFAQSLTLTQFSIKGGAEEIAKSLENAPAGMLSFLMNVAVSVTGFCELTWGKKDQWHSLVEALLIEIPGAEHSMLPQQFLHALPDAKTKTSIYDRLIATPPLAVLLLIRWLRVDLLQQKVDDHLKQIIANRSNSPTS